ncbi:MAG: hypothetical protein AAB486_03280 [Patescibacteria group bacterium]
MAITSLVPLGTRLIESIPENSPAGNLALVVSTVRALRKIGVNRVLKLQEIRTAVLNRMMDHYLGEIIVREDTGEAIVFPLGYDRKKTDSRFGIPQMVGMHPSAFQFGDSIRSGASRVTVHLRALPRDDRPWREPVIAAKQTANKPMRRFLDELIDFFGAEPGIAFKGVISGPAGNVLRRGRREANALARAEKGLGIKELENARTAVLRHIRDEEVPYRQTVRYLFLTTVEEQDSTFKIGNFKRCFGAIWNIVLENGWQLKALLDLPVDKIFQVEHLGGVNYARAQITATATSLAELDRIEATLQMFCKEVERLHAWEPYGASMLGALMASLPGSPRELHAPVFSIPDPEFTAVIGATPMNFFDQIGAVPNVSTQGVTGNIAFGRAISANQLDQHTLTFSTEEYQVAAVVGESKSGKSVLAWAMAIQAAGRNIVFVHHSTTAEEFAGRLARLWGGTYLNVDLPIVNTEEEFRAAVKVICDEITLKFKRWEAEWEIAGHPVHLPLVIRVNSGTEALAVFYKRYVRGEIIRLLSKFYERGWRFSLVDDDLADLPDPGVRDYDLEMIPANEGSALRHDVSASVNKIRKAGCKLYLLTIQNQLHFDAYGPGMYKSIPLAFLISPGSHNVGAIVRPKEMPTEMEGFSFEEAARAIIDGKGVTLPSWLIAPKLFNPWLPETIRRQMGVN